MKLGDFKGQSVVLYFYPRDDTPGCTKEACAFRDASKQLNDLGAVVLGVSPDAEASHAKFRDKFSLNFPLLAKVKSPRWPCGSAREELLSSAAGTAALHSRSESQLSPLNCPQLNF